MVSQKSDDRRDDRVYTTLEQLVQLQFEARGFSFLPRYAIQSMLSGRHRSRLRGRGLDFEEVREYVRGDDIRNIDWKVTARTGQTHSKVFTEERDRQVFCLVDQSQNMYFGSSRYTKSVVAAHLAALAGWRVLDVGDRFGGIVSDGESLEMIVPQRDKRALLRLLGIIADYNNKLSLERIPPDTCVLDEMLRRIASNRCHDCLVLVISDFRQYSDNTFRRLLAIKRHNDVVALNVTDSFEKEIGGQRVIIGDGVHQEIAGGSSKAWKGFMKANTRRNLNLAETLKRYRIPLVEISTSESAALQIRRKVGSGRRNIRK